MVTASLNGAVMMFVAGSPEKPVRDFVRARSAATGVSVASSQVLLSSGSGTEVFVMHAVFVVGSTVLTVAVIMISAVSR